MAEEIKKESLDRLNDSFTAKNINLVAEIEQIKESSLKEIELKSKDFIKDQPTACIDLADFIIRKITDKEPGSALLNQCYERIK